MSSFTAATFPLSPDEQRNDDDDDDEDDVERRMEREALRARSARNSAVLREHKMRISEHSRMRATNVWDRCKKLDNPYELIGGAGAAPALAAALGTNISAPLHSGLSGLTPTSRSYFKLTEILHTFTASLGVDRPGKMRVAFLAEGPGGFVEAFRAFRAGAGRRHVVDDEDDELHGITLAPTRANKERSKNNNNSSSSSSSSRVPYFVPQHGLRVHRGADGTGNLYNLDNVDHFVSATGGRGGCDLVTADGGFDFSADFAAQEETSLELLLCEAYAAALLLREGGALVLKLYDVYLDATIQLLGVLRAAFASVVLTKPAGSRPANSEKYAICTGFCGGKKCGGAAATASCLRRIIIVRRARQHHRHASPPPSSLSSSSSSSSSSSTTTTTTTVVVDCHQHHQQPQHRVPLPLLRDVVRSSEAFGSLQAACIDSTLSLVVGPPSSVADLARMLRTQLECSERWCLAHRVSVCPQALECCHVLLGIVTHREDTQNPGLPRWM